MINSKDKLTVFIILFLTALVIFILDLIPGYLKIPGEDHLAGLSFVIVFILFDFFFIGIPAWLHYIYVKDYSKVKNIWFFAIFGSVTGSYFDVDCIFYLSLFCD